MGMLAASASRITGRGSGSMIGGRVMLRLDPQAMRRLGSGRRVVLVTGTNGKTTTTRMLSCAMSVCGDVATNADGSNMPDGLAGALARHLHAPYAVLEVDEMHLGLAARDLDPQAMVLLNLSRDQLDRVGEVRNLEARLRGVIAEHPKALVVANADDVLVASAAFDAHATGRVVWVSAGSGWQLDATSCPRCSGTIEASAQDWSCECGLRRPEATWALEEDKLVTPGGTRLPLQLRLPGRVNRANAAMAIAAAAELGAPPEVALPRLAALSHVEGRYRTVRLGEHTARFLLAKNPAGWHEMLEMIDQGDRPVVLVVNGRVPDGCDLSWLWDVQFERLRGHPVVASGERAEDLSVRLAYAEVEHRVEPDPLAAIAAAPPGELEVLANYTAFRELVVRTGGNRPEVPA
jgi:lipid II isoglutaminyl synthase (glutamine-hydrolysing)